MEMFVYLDSLDFCVRITHSYFRGQRGKLTVENADAFKLFNPECMSVMINLLCFPPAVCSSAEETAPPGGAAEQ